STPLRPWRWQAGGPQPAEAPEIDYLAKDYASFRQLMLNRIALLMPQWTETNPADIGITLVEIMAYVADQLSYYQDAVATEAYLGTARQRISVRRHARLVDYHLHEGSNARAWLALTTSADVDVPARQAAFITGLNAAGAAQQAVVAAADIAALPATGYEYFEPMVCDPAATLRLRVAHNEIRF